MPPPRAGRKRGSPQWLRAVVRRKRRRWCRARLSFGRNQIAKLDACHIYGLTVTCNPRVCDEAQVESNGGPAACPNGAQDISPQRASRQNISRQGTSLRDFSRGGTALQDCASRHEATKKVVAREGEGIS